MSKGRGESERQTGGGTNEVRTIRKWGGETDRQTAERARAEVGGLECGRSGIRDPRWMSTIK